MFGKSGDEYKLIAADTMRLQYCIIDMLLMLRDYQQLSED